jgi:hypothetical protein
MTDGRIRLLSILGEIHVHAGIRYWDRPLRLGLAFAGRGFLRIREQRGAGISFDGEPLRAAGLGEGGRIEMHDVTDRLDPSLRGAPLTAIRAIEEAERVLGLALERPGRALFCIWVDDDEFHWGDEQKMIDAFARRKIEVRTERRIR